MMSDYIRVNPDNYESIYMAYSKGAISFETLKEKIKELKEKKEKDAYSL